MLPPANLNNGSRSRNDCEWQLWQAQMARAARRNGLFARLRTLVGFRRPEPSNLEAFPMPQVVERMA